MIRPPATSRDGIVFLDRLKIAHVIHRKHRRIFLAAQTAKITELLTEQIVTGHDDDIVIHVLRCEHVINITNRAELVGIVSGTIVHDGEIQF